MAKEASKHWTVKKLYVYVYSHMVELADFSKFFEIILFYGVLYCIHLFTVASMLKFNKTVLSPSPDGASSG